MEKKVLKEILAMDKKELRNLVEEQGDRIDLGIYLLYVWDKIKNGLVFKYPTISKSILEISRIFNECGWEIKDYLKKRREYKYFEEKENDERKKIIITDYLFRLNPKLKVIDYNQFFDEEECALKISVTLEGNQMIYIDMIDISRHIDDIIDSITNVEREIFKIYQSLH